MGSACLTGPLDRAEASAPRMPLHRGSLCVVPSWEMTEADGWKVAWPPRCPGAVTANHSEGLRRRRPVQSVSKAKLCAKSSADHVSTVSWPCTAWGLPQAGLLPLPEVRFWGFRRQRTPSLVCLFTHYLAHHVDLRRAAEAGEGASGDPAESLALLTGPTPGHGPHPLGLGLSPKLTKSF